MPWPCFTVGCFNVEDVAGEQINTNCSGVINSLPLWGINYKCVKLWWNCHFVSSLLSVFLMTPDTDRRGRRIVLKGSVEEINQKFHKHQCLTGVNNSKHSFKLITNSVVFNIVSIHPALLPHNLILELNGRLMPGNLTGRWVTMWMNSSKTKTAKTCYIIL